MHGDFCIMWVDSVCLGGCGKVVATVVYLVEDNMNVGVYPYAVIIIIAADDNYHIATMRSGTFVNDPLGGLRIRNN